MTISINDLTTEDMGKLFPIFIVEYNPEWPELYLTEEQKIKEAAGSKNIHSIQHIGSTAVPGLSAKPTIDIMIEIADKTNKDIFIDNLRSLGYHYIPKPENPPPHMMFAKGYTMEGVRGQTFHIHIRYPGDWDEPVFRDYLLRNPETASAYGELKKSLSITYRNDREKYTAAKADFITEIVKLARSI